MANTYVGIDVSKHQLDLAVWGAADVDCLPHDRESFEALRDRLTALAAGRRGHVLHLPVGRDAGIADLAT